MCSVYDFDVCVAIKVTYSIVQLMRNNCTWYNTVHAKVKVTCIALKLQISCILYSSASLIKMYQNELVWDIGDARQFDVQFEKKNKKNLVWSAKMLDDCLYYCAWIILNNIRSLLLEFKSYTPAKTRVWHRKNTNKLWIKFASEENKKLFYFFYYDLRPGRVTGMNGV